jgi:O-antigen/teichoic acid export membrane protein
MKYFKNTSWLFMGKILKMGIGFFVIILLTRYLGPENFGVLSYAQSFVAMFVAFTTLGLEVILVRELTKNCQKTDSILGTAFVLKITASLIAFLSVISLSFFLEDKVASLLTNIIAISLIFESVNLGFDTFFQANVISKFSVIAKSFVDIICAVIKLLLIFLKADLIYFGWVVVFNATSIFIGYLYIYKLQNRSILSLKFNKELAIYFLKSGWPMMMVAMAVFFYTKIDQIMIKHLLDNEAVGYYAAAIRVSELFYFIPLLIAQSVFPKIVHERDNGDTENYFQLLLNLYKINLWISIPIVFLVILFRSTIIEILYGEAFIQSAEILSVLAFCLILVSIGSVSTKILYVEHYEKKYLKRSILGIFTNIGLNFVLIPTFGAIGAAYASLFTLFTIHYIYDLFDKDLWKFYYLKLKCFIPNLK